MSYGQLWGWFKHLKHFFKLQDIKNMINQWGFLRETDAKAQIAGIDKDTGLKRTGLETYL